MSERLDGRRLIPHNSPTLGEAEKAAAARVIDSGWVAQGREVEAFEEEVCRYLGLAAGHCVALSSGTSALFLALWVLGARGKRVAIPVYSCAAVRNAVVMAGAEPVPIDSAQDSPNIDMNQAAEGRTEVIIAAQMFGTPSRLNFRGAAPHVIEDCAQAFGAAIDGRPVGLNGSVGVYSFYATKMLTSGGQGGMLVSGDKSISDAARDYREFDCRRDRIPRFNLQMTDLQAALGRVQLSQLENFVRARRHTHSLYLSAGLDLWPKEPSSGIEPCCYRAILRTDDPAQVIERLAQEGIGAIVPVAEWELLAEPDGFPRAASLSRTTVSIPIHPSLTRPDIDHIIKAALAATNPVRLELT
jgi:perosamine synthetase